MPYGARVLYNSVDISDKVESFDINRSLDQYCDEITITVNDATFYDALSFAQLPAAPLLQVYTRVDNDWVSQGSFYIERPDLNNDIMSTSASFWGRSTTARLGEPFAPKVTKVWEENTTLFAVCQEMCDLCGLTWSSTYSEIEDFVVFAYTFEVENSYPIEVMSELLEHAYGPGAFITTDLAGHICIKLRQYTPSASDFAVTDPISVSIAEQPEWPDFGNRVKLVVSGTAAGYNVQLTIIEKCLLVNASAQTKVYARVTDQEGTPLNDIPVTFSSEEGLLTLSPSVVNTATITVFDEIVNASSYYTVKTAFPPELVYGIYAFLDTNKSNNLTGNGYTLDGNEIAVTDAFKYCDLKVRVVYSAKGVASTVAYAGATIGDDKITAEVYGNFASGDVAVGNPCACPPSISMEVARSNICPGDSTGILIYVEEGSSAVTDNRMVFAGVISSPAHGGLEWTYANLGNVTIDEEKSTSRNEAEGNSTCESAKFIVSVSSVYLADADGVAYGSNLYSSFSGKTITLNTRISSDLDLLITYVTCGAVVNHYTGMLLGQDKITAYLKVARSEPIEAFTQITVQERCDGDDDDDDDDDGGSEGGSEGLCDTEESPCDNANTAAGGTTTQKVHGLKSGTEGCYPPGEIDTFGGKYRCWKDDVYGLYDEAASCDACEDQKVYGNSNGTAGCYTIDELDTQEDPTTGETKYSGFKNGEAGWWLEAELDAGSGGGKIECPAGTECCENITTGKKGCYPKEQCKSGSGSGGKKGKTTFTPGKKDCLTTGSGYMNDTYVECLPPNQCCTNKSTNKKGCFPKEQCKEEEKRSGCYSKDCSKSSYAQRSNCVSGRFANAIGSTDENGTPCSCREICLNELRKYGTTQGYSTVSIEDIVTAATGLVSGDAGFDEAWASAAQIALDQCLAECGDCEKIKTAVTIGGSDAVTKPGGYQYYAGGGFAPYTFSVSGTGATITSDGYLTLSDDACGSAVVTVTDKCGVSDSKAVRITNAGKWVNVGVTGGYCWHTYMCTDASFNNLVEISESTRRAWGSGWLGSAAGSISVCTGSACNTLECRIAEIGCPPALKSLLKGSTPAPVGYCWSGVQEEWCYYTDYQEWTWQC